MPIQSRRLSISHLSGGTNGSRSCGPYFKVRPLKNSEQQNPFSTVSKKHLFKSRPDQEELLDIRFGQRDSITYRSSEESYYTMKTK